MGAGSWALRYCASRRGPAIEVELLIVDSLTSAGPVRVGQPFADRTPTVAFGRRATELNSKLFRISKLPPRCTPRSNPPIWRGFSTWRPARQTSSMRQLPPSPPAKTQRRQFEASWPALKNAALKPFRRCRVLPTPAYGWCVGSCRVPGASGRFGAVKGVYGGPDALALWMTADNRVTAS